MSYGGDGDRGKFLNVANWVLIAIALVAVILRFVSRATLEKAGWGGDDAFLLLAMGVNLARAIYVSVCIQKGFGQHLHILLQQNPIATTKLLRLIVILQSIGLWTFTLPKIPVAILLVRLFGTTTKWLAIVLYSMVGFLLSWALIVTVTTFAQCTPVAAQWDVTVKGKCWNKAINVDLGYVLGALSALMDFAFALYPCVQISRLQMKRSRKILIASALSLGFVACITTCYKQSEIDEILNTGDPTWATIPLEVWNSVEGAALIIAASVPLARPLIIVIVKKFSEITSRLTRTTESLGQANDASGKVSKHSDTAPHDRSSNHSSQRDDGILLHKIQPLSHDVESARQDTAGIYKTVDFNVSGGKLVRGSVPPRTFI